MTTAAPTQQTPTTPPRNENLSAEIWGPHYWFFLHTLAYGYPEFPNDITRRKYYDVIMNFPLFIPNPEIGNRFAAVLDKYPLTPYLENRESFMRWVCFIHNRINNSLGKEEVTYLDSLQKYANQYEPKRQNVGLTSFVYNSTEYLCEIYRGIMGWQMQAFMIIIFCLVLFFSFRFCKI